MDENRQTEGLPRDNCSLTMPDISNSSEDRQIQEFPGDTRYTLGNISPETAFNFGVRTAERSRIFADNISSTIQGIRPLIQQAAVCIIQTILDIKQKQYFLSNCLFSWNSLIYHWHHS